MKISMDFYDGVFDSSLEDALYLLKKLRNLKSYLWIETDLYQICFSVIDDCRSMEVEIDGNDCWVIAAVNVAEGEQIIRIACEGGNFNKFIPTTDRIWGAIFSLKDN